MSVSDTQCEVKIVGVNFKPNISLSTRYERYLTSTSLTSPSTFLQTTESSVMVATAGAGTADPLVTLNKLANRHGFTRCSGRLFAVERLVRGRDEFYEELRRSLPSSVVIRTHVHPQSLSADILDFIDSEEEFKERKIRCSPTSFSHVLVAVSLSEDRVGWTLYTAHQYRASLARPGDGDRLPTFSLNFNRAELKIAEALQLLSLEQSLHLFQSEPLLVVDVGAAPGGWTGFLARQSPNVSVLAVDPGMLESSVLSLTNVSHLACKAENLSADDGRLLAEEATALVGSDWASRLRCIVCDANLDIRDTLRELVLPLATFLPVRGILIVTLKLGRRVGVDGIQRKVDSAMELLTEAGFPADQTKVEWLFGNSKNERTIFAIKRNNK